MSEQKTQPDGVRLLDQVRGKIRLKHYSIRTEQTYVDWIRRYILYFDKRHPRELGVAEVEAFLTHLAVVGKVAAATQNQAKSALLTRLAGTHWLMASLLYGAGLRLMECLRLRVKDIDLARKEILVRDGKGFKDRVTSPLDRLGMA